LDSQVGICCEGAQFEILSDRFFIVLDEQIAGWIRLAAFSICPPAFEHADASGKFRPIN
jgi:hypothetical protein